MFRGRIIFPLCLLGKIILGLEKHAGVTKVKRAIDGQQPTDKSG
jgi:hypothetical protein